MTQAPVNPRRPSRQGAAARVSKRTAKPAGTETYSAEPRGEVLTVEEFCTELKVSKDTFYHWRKVGTAPACLRLPNGELRIERAARDAWLAALRDVA